MSNELTSAERRALKARAHTLHPVVMIGNDGLTPAVLREIDLSLQHHDLVKIRAGSGDRGARAAMLTAICAGVGAAPVQHIGKVLVIFRALPVAATPPAAVSPKPRRAARPAPKPGKTAAGPVWTRVRRPAARGR